MFLTLLPIILFAGSAVCSLGYFVQTSSTIRSSKLWKDQDGANVFRRHIHSHVGYVLGIMALSIMFVAVKLSDICTAGFIMGGQNETYIDRIWQLWDSIVAFTLWLVVIHLKQEQNGDSELYVYTRQCNDKPKNCPYKN